MAAASDGTAAETLALPGGRRVLLRRLVPADTDAIFDLLRREDPEDIRLRFFRSKPAITREHALSLNPADDPSEHALGVFLPDEDGALAAVGTLHVDEARSEAEFAVLVASHLKGGGLGALLLGRLVAEAARAGLRRIYGDVLRENWRMRALAEELGFVAAGHPTETMAVRVVRDLGDGAV